jgi:hypothetical protein
MMFFHRVAIAVDAFAETKVRRASLLFDRHWKILVQSDANLQNQACPLALRNEVGLLLTIGIRDFLSRPGVFLL